MCRNRVLHMWAIAISFRERCLLPRICALPPPLLLPALLVGPANDSRESGRSREDKTGEIGYVLSQSILYRSSRRIGRKKYSSQSVGSFGSRTFTSSVSCTLRSFRPLDCTSDECYTVARGATSLICTEASLPQKRSPIHHAIVSVALQKLVYAGSESAMYCLSTT